MFEHPIEIAVAVVAGGLAKAIYDIIISKINKQDNFVTTKQCTDYRSTCINKNSHDFDTMKQDIKELHEKTNCIDRKLARIIGGLEAKGWLQKQAEE